MADRRARLVTVPTTIGDAMAYVRRYHRHHGDRTLNLFALACAPADGEICGVAVVSRPNAGALCDGWTAEVSRVCTDGTPNACSHLYAAAWRAARALGWRKLMTYTLASEGGASLRGAGWKCIGEAGGGTWNRPNCGRPRVDRHPTQIKLRWEVCDDG